MRKRNDLGGHVSAVPPGITVTGTRQRQAWVDRVLPPVERVRPGLWSIPTPFPGSPLRYVLSYAVACDGGVALIDTGWPAEAAWDALTGGLAEAGWDIGDVKAVLITHGHGDHMGLARRVREASGAWVAMHEADANPASTHHFDLDDFRRATDEAMRRRGGREADFSAVRQGTMPDASTFSEFALTVDRYLPDGGRPLGPGSGLVSIHTPGHTLGHTSFYDRDRNVLLTGDHVLPRITPNISPAPGQDDDLLGRYIGSLRAVAGIPAGEVLPAHEYRFRGLAERVHGLLAHHQARLGEVMAAVQAGPGRTSVEVAGALEWSRPWADVIGPQRRFAVGEAYSHLVHLERTGYLVNKGLDVDSWYPLRDTSPTLTP
ncbi:MAG: MBL fold metallo-hydrolase [Nocardiopsaceae bacterium]|nr:MBL fold metallo-hydrolase [Nocardiopsaceae bacterium]